MKFVKKSPSPLEQVARPLLLLAQHISGMESTFITSIDWDALSQTVLFASNGSAERPLSKKGALQVVEGSVLDWHDSMCRSLLVSGVEQSCAVGADVSATPWAQATQVQSFFAVPILAGDTTIGTVCGASRRKLALDEQQLDALRLIADALQRLLEVERATSIAHARVEAAERDAVEARRATRRHAVHSQHMEQLANTDVLTGLPNRRAFMTRWEGELVRSVHANYHVGLMLLDADRFKTVNDTEGHAIGDAVLRAIGATLMVVVHSPDVVARLGGDEFAVLTTQSDSAHLKDLAAKIANLFKVVAAELGVDTTLSIGMVSSEHCPRERMLAEADKALYRSKNAGGNASRMTLCDGSPSAETPARARTVRAA